MLAVIDSAPAGRVLTEVRGMPWWPGDGRSCPQANAALIKIARSTDVPINCLVTTTYLVTLPNPWSQAKYHSFRRSIGKVASILTERSRARRILRGIRFARLTIITRSGL